MKIIIHSLMAALPIIIILLTLQIISLTTAWVSALVVVLALLCILITGVVLLYRAFDEDEPL